MEHVKLGKATPSQLCYCMCVAQRIGMQSGKLSSTYLEDISSHGHIIATLLLNAVLLT